jgi:nucleoside-diphosphate-sugar epimerase
MSQTPLTVVVTGGAGYLGRVLVDQLLEGSVLEPTEVRVFDLTSPARSDPRLSWVRGDVRDSAALRKVCQSAHLVIHCAAIVDWGRVAEHELESVNVGGTRNVIEACRAEGVPSLVHTSTMDVVYTGRPIIDGDETLPLAIRFPNAYCRTKTEAERIALAANDSELAHPGPNGERRLRVVAIRPCCIYGEDDPHHIGSLLAMANRGRLMRIGDGRARSQFCYVGNVAHLQLLAAKALRSPESPPAAGRAYFVTDAEPANFFEFLAPFVEAAGHRMPSAARALPRGPLYALGALLEGVAWAVRPVTRFTPVITRFAVDFVCLDFTIRTDRASRELGYVPRYSPRAAQERTIAHYRDLGQPAR